ncbi:MAG: M3 family metallopeptidase [Ideonella sp.]|nr:M3 family metallopeptidase [Ideonella sp.]MCC7456162.1 M3 family metallopeptidase [Nitrospira sp.]
MDAAVNPLLIAWDSPFDLPPFALVRSEHFKPAFEHGMRAHKAELAHIAAQAAAPDFDNTLVAFDASGRLLARVEALFHNLAASATDDALQAVQREMAAPLAAHWSAVYMDDALFARVDAVHARRDTLGLDTEQRRLLERVHLDFVRAGARLTGPARTRCAELMQRLAELTTTFAQNVLHDEASYALELRGEADLSGLPAWLRAAAHQAALERGLPGGHVITLARSLIVPFLSFSPRRDLREQAWRAWVSRGEHDGAHDNRPVAAAILALRREQAALHGHASYADYALADSMAREPAQVWALLDSVWAKAVPALERERALLLRARDAQGVREPIEAWDWRFWAEQVRREHYALDEAELKGYFPLPAMVQAAFDCAQRLFGLRFSARPDLATYHADALAYEVADAAGRTIGLFVQDNFARAGKRSGAWMSALHWQHRNGFESRPVVLNNNNFARGEAGGPTLLSLDDVRTLFHEFGHGLHGLLSNVRYERLSGTQVLRDFVELPSQLFEHWIDEPEVLQRHARHWQTGEPIPAALIERVRAARRFGQGYESVRYTASALVDLAAHTAAGPIDDIVAFEQRVLAERRAPAVAGLNHRLPHFQHLFSGSGYAAGYYVYLWAEVLDADAYDAFVEAGDPFDAQVAERLRRWVYASGNSVEPGAAYEAFRGRAARVEPMLRERGLIGT